MNMTRFRYIPYGNAKETQASLMTRLALWMLAKLWNQIPYSLSGRRSVPTWSSRVWTQSNFELCNPLEPRPTSVVSFCQVSWVIWTKQDTSSWACRAMRARCVNKLLSHTRLCIRQAKDVSEYICLSCSTSHLLTVCCMPKPYCYALVAKLAPICMIANLSLIQPIQRREASMHCYFVMCMFCQHKCVHLL